jgi:hypothetical protein
LTAVESISDLERATSTIAPQSLLAARSAVATDCALYIRWAEALSEKVDSIKRAADLKKLAKAVALVHLGYLPTRPNTCPFCIQYAGDLACRGCGYAKTHGGRCDQDTSAFRLFIGAFQDLGSAIYQDNDLPDIDLKEGKSMLHDYIEKSIGAARRMPGALGRGSTLKFMEAKALFLKQAALLLPICLFSKEVREKHHRVLEMLKDYW